MHWDYFATSHNWLSIDPTSSQRLIFQHVNMLLSYHDEIEIWSIEWINSFIMKNRIVTTSVNGIWYMRMCPILSFGVNVEAWEHDWLAFRRNSVFLPGGNAFKGANLGFCFLHDNTWGKNRWPEAINLTIKLVNGEFGVMEHIKALHFSIIVNFLFELI